MSYVNHDLIRPTVFVHGTGTSALTTKPVVIYNIHIVVATATQTFTIKDGTGGDTILVIPASTAINSNFEFPGGLYLTNGIHITVGSSATGTMRFDYTEVSN
jgi:hypothetical protein